MKNRSGRKRKYVGAHTDVTPGGLLRIRFRASLPGGPDRYYFAETTDLRDTEENRARVEASCDRIGEDLSHGRFDYLRWFPQGKQAARFLWARANEEPQSPQTLREYYELWLPRQRPRVAAATYRDYIKHLQGHVVPRIGHLPIGDLTRDHLEDLRVTLLADAGLAQKTVKNIVAGSLRALVRDALDAGTLERDPYANLRWLRIEFDDPDPFTADERDRILEASRELTYRSGLGTGRYHSGPHGPYFAAIRTLFYTGCRPSEVLALRVRQVDLDGRALIIRGSNVERKRGAPKTRSAERRVAVDPATAAVLAELVDEQAPPDAPFFRAPMGGAMEYYELRKAFRAAQEVAEVRLRGLYSTKDTFSSLYLSAGGRIEWLSEQTGVSERTLRRHYAKYIRRREQDDAEFRRLTRKGPQRARKSRQEAKEAVNR